MLRRLPVNEDEDIEQALSAARPEPEPLSSGKAHAVFEQALAASRVCERRPGRQLLWYVAGPVATAACVAGLLLLLKFRDADTLPSPSPSITSETVRVRAAVTKKRPGATRPAVIADRAGAPAPAAATAARPRAVQAVRSRRRQRASEARLAQAAVVTPTVASLPPATTAPVSPVQPAPREATGQPAASEATSARLLVSVTSAPPVLEVTVREASAEVPGYAQAAAVHSDAYRRPYWTQYTVSSENTSAEVVLIAQSEGDASSSENRTGNEKE